MRGRGVGGMRRYVGEGGQRNGVYVGEGGRRNGVYGGGGAEEWGVWGRGVEEWGVWGRGVGGMGCMGEGGRRNGVYGGGGAEEWGICGRLSHSMPDQPFSGYSINYHNMLFGKVTTSSHRGASLTPHSGCRIIKRFLV